MLGAHILDRGKVDRCIFANGGVRAATRFNTGNAVRGQCPRPGHEFGILAGVNIVGDRGDIELVAHGLAQPFQKGGFARTNRATDTNAKG